MRITLIGAGFTGTALAIELVRRRGPDVEVCLIDSARTFGRGVAYGSTRPEHLLNVPADRMGLDPHAPGDFADWLELQESSRQAFVPRQLYGDYLSRRLEQAIGDQPDVHRYRTEAISLERVPGGFRVYTADGDDFFTDIAVLTVGALPPQPLPALSPSLRRHHAYIGWPWRDDVLEGIDPEASVLIVGTGLTMVDVVATLGRRDHHGPLLAVSRHGLLPRAHVRAPVVSPPPALLRALDGANVRRLTRCLRELSRVADDWRSVVDSLRPFTQLFWRNLDNVQRRRFLRHLHTWWQVHRHRIASDAAVLIGDQIDAGQLRVEAAHLLHARLDQGRILTLRRPRGGDHSVRQHVDVIVRATGLDTDIDSTVHGLIAHLRESGLVTADPHGLGIRATAAGQVLDAHGRDVDGLYCLGPLLRGECWEITAVPELRDAASSLATRLLDRRHGETRVAAATHSASA